MTADEHLPRARKELAAALAARTGKHLADVAAAIVASSAVPPATQPGGAAS